MRDCLTADDIANGIRMHRSQYSGAFLIVEGETGDPRVYGRFVDPEACEVISVHGKALAMEVLHILEADSFQGVLAIVDADFWRLDNISPPSPNLFLTDSHDLETMLIESPAFDKLVNEFGSKNKVLTFCSNASTGLRQTLLAAGCHLGYLRWVSQKHALALKFDGIVFTRFVARNTLCIDIAKLFHEVKSKSSRHDIQNSKLTAFISKSRNANHNLWDLCCGHDLLCILSIALRSAIGTNKENDVKPEILEKSLRLAYETEHFRHTALYRSLESWEALNRTFRLFPLS